MSSRPDLREIVSNVRDAFADADRDTLLDVLTFVIKEYVVEGPPPMLVHQAETLADLQGASFAQVIQALQTRFDHAELAMFVVDGEQVGVRIGGVVHPLLASRQPPAAELPRPAAGVRVVETTLAPRPPAPAEMIDTRPAPAASAPATAPPPARGLAVRGRPSGDVAPAAGAPATAPAAPSASSGASAPSAAPEKPDDGDDASARFSLLELD